MKKYFIFIIFVIFTIFLIAFSCAQPGSGGGGSGKKKSTPSVPNGYIFPGGLEVKTFGFIDLNDNGVLDDGDPLANLNYITINGNQTSTFTFPDDFIILAAPSGSIFFSLTNANDYNGNKFYFSSLAFEAYQPTINSAEIVGGITPELPLKLGEVTQIFYGGVEVPLSGLIDVDGDGIMDKDDLFMFDNITINDDVLLLGDAGGFAVVPDCGYISVNLSNANAFNGKKFYCGAIYPEWGYPIANNNAIISSGATPTLSLQSLKLNEEVLVTHQFYPGTPVYVGGFIDVNGNGIMDNGDYGGGTSEFNIIPGENEVNLDASLFGKISNSGFIRVNLKFNDDYEEVKGKKFYYGTFHVNGIKAIVNNSVINSPDMILIIK